MTYIELLIRLCMKVGNREWMEIASTLRAVKERIALTK